MATTTATTRRLAAILAADVVGYSRLMGADEEGTHERVKAHLVELVDPKIREHRGRIVKTTGDGVLAEFASVVDAVRCAGEIQSAMADRDLDLAEERRLRFRIGVNLGDVIVDSGDIYGDGVNIAVRLEGLAAPGGICVSGTVRDHIGDRLPYAFEDMGEQSVKNISRPVKVYALRPEGITGVPTASMSPAVSSSPPAAAPRLSIVVLPFTNLSDDREQQYFADGQIGRELGVRYVLEGSVRRSGNQVRVNAQLIDAANDTHLWAARLDHHAGDLFVLQNDITSCLANCLGVELIAAEAARPTEHPDALDYILRGRAARLKPYSRENKAEQISLFERALALDPQSVEAQSRLAGSLVDRVHDPIIGSATADLKRAEGLVGRALAAKPRSAYVHFVKGRVLHVQGRYEEAVPEFETALALNRNMAGALHELGSCRLFTGSIDEVIPLVEQAICLSPRDPDLGWRYFQIGSVHLLQSRIAEAIVWLEKGRSAIPAAPNARSWLASAYALRGETARAAAELAEARKLSGDDRYSSVTRMRAVRHWGVPKIRALFETAYFAGLRKAGVPEE